jgi:hypothetical protein
VAAHALVLALALAGDPNSGELPHWTEVPEASEPPKAKVPSDGSGMMTLGTLLLVSGSIVGTSAVVLAAEPELSPTSFTGMYGMLAGVQLGAGTVFLTLGLVVRKQFERKPAIPGAPRTGGGMLLGGLGLMLGGTGYAALAIVDIGSDICPGGSCRPIRPIGAPIQLGFSIASALVGTGLFAAGVRRRAGYLRWDAARLRPVASGGPGGFQVGIMGRF